MEPAIPTGAEQQAARDSYAKNKAYAYDSQAKSLLYGGGGVADPKAQGRKSVPHPGSGGADAPFATYDKAAMTGSSLGQVQGGQLAKEFNAKQGQKEGAGKESMASFDPSVYRDAINANASNRAAQRARAWGNGNITGFKKDAQQEQEEAAAAQQQQLP